jgi:predicted metalloprotease
VTQGVVEAEADTADQGQAAYYHRMLSEFCREINQRIATYDTILSRYEMSGNRDDARRVRRMIRAEERQRQMLSRMIDKLQRRFPLPI